MKQKLINLYLGHYRAMNDIALAMDKVGVTIDFQKWNSVDVSGELLKLILELYEVPEDVKDGFCRDYIYDRIDSISDTKHPLTTKVAMVEDFLETEKEDNFGERNEDHTTIQ